MLTTPPAVPEWSLEKMRSRADDLNREHNPSGAIPVPIEQIVDVRYGMDIVPTLGLWDHFEVGGFITSDLTAIWVDQSLRPAQFVFTLAREFAHSVLHSDYYSSYSFTTVAEWRHTVSCMPTQHIQAMAVQSTTFASLLLVPSEPLA